MICRFVPSFWYCKTLLNMFVHDCTCLELPYSKSIKLFLNFIFSSRVLPLSHLSSLSVSLLGKISTHVVSYFTTDFSHLLHIYTSGSEHSQPWFPTGTPYLKSVNVDHVDHYLPLPSTTLAGLVPVSISSTWSPSPIHKSPSVLLLLLHPSHNQSVPKFCWFYWLPISQILIFSSFLLLPW